MGKNSQSIIAGDEIILRIRVAEVREQRYSGRPTLA